MKKLCIIATIFLLFTQLISNAISPNTQYGYGIYLSTFPSGKTYVIVVFNNSPAQKAGVKVGDEIVYVNNHNISIYTDVEQYAKEKNPAEFTIYDTNNQLKYCNITKSNYIVPSDGLDDYSRLYWNQICTNVPYISDEITTLQKIRTSNNCTEQDKNLINIRLQYLYYLKEKKIQFINCYKTYKLSYSKEQMPTKMEELVKDIKSEIQGEKQVIVQQYKNQQYQQQLYRQQQQNEKWARRQQVSNAINQTLNNVHDDLKYNDMRNLKLYEIYMNNKPKTYNVNYSFRPYPYCGF